MDNQSIFISYSSKDTADVKRVIDALESEKLSYWKAPDMIPVGSNYAKEIPRVIGGCDIFLLLISKHSQQSIWVEKEIDFAVNNRKTIVPLNIDGCEMTEMFKFYLNNVQMIFLDKDTSMTALLDRIKFLLGDIDNVTRKSEELKNDSKEEEKRRMSLNELEINSARGRIRRRTNDKSFGLNPQPDSCLKCGSDVKMDIPGVYICVKCGEENLDYYNTVRRYLQANGPASKYTIERATGVPRASIDYFFSQGQLEYVGKPLGKA